MVIPLVKVDKRIGKRKRVGRGISAGQGKTCSRGTKGQGARTGDSIPPRFEGGRTTIIRQLPKFDGFIHKRKVVYHAVNLKDLERIPVNIDRIDPNVLSQYGLLPKGKLVKILGEGEAKRVMNISAHAFSQSAREKIEAKGGRCEVIRR